MHHCSFISRRLADNEDFKFVDMELAILSDFALNEQSISSFEFLDEFRVGIKSCKHLSPVVADCFEKVDFKLLDFVLFYDQIKFPC